MNVDVRTRTEIAAPVSAVAAFASEPDNAPRWYANIKSVEWQTPWSMEIGSRFVFVANFLGRRLEYAYEVPSTTSSPTPAASVFAAEPVPVNDCPDEL